MEINSSSHFEDSIRELAANNREKLAKIDSSLVEKSFLQSNPFYEV